MKLRTLNTTLALIFTSCAWVAQADPIVYNFSVDGTLGFSSGGTAPGKLEGELTLSDNPTASNYYNLNGFVGLAELAQWHSMGTYTSVTFQLFDSTGTKLGASNTTSLNNSQTYTNLDRSWQNINLNGNSIYLNTVIQDPTYVMASLVNVPETGAKLSDVIDLFKVASFNVSASGCVEYGQREIMPGLLVDSCINSAWFSGNSGTFSGNDSTPPPDADGDGINDAEPLVLIAGLETDVPNYMLADGVTTLSQGIAAKLDESAALGVEVSSYMSAYLNELKDAGIITGKEKGKLQSAISKSKGK